LSPARKPYAAERHQVTDSNTDEKKGPEEKKEGNDNSGSRPSRP
jgi:hypothetical protein